MTELSTVLTGLRIGESPRWHDGRLWLCNWGTGDVIAVDGSGRSEVMATAPVPIPYSIDWLPDGTLLVLALSELLRQEPGGSLRTHADLRGIASGFNEIVVDGRGTAYVNGGDFNPMTDAEFTPGLIAAVRPDGSARQVADDIHFGNGMAVTADGATLVVAESYARRLTAFDITADGGLTGRRVWADLGDGVPDGICLDAEGAVWYADVPNRRCVRVREGGEVLRTVPADRGCFACMLGGADGRTLHVTAAVWHGMHNAPTAQLDGVLGTTRVDVPAAGYPAVTAG